MRVIVTPVNMPAFVNGSPSTKACASARVFTFTINRLPTNCLPSSLVVAPEITRMSLDLINRGNVPLFVLPRGSPGAGSFLLCGQKKLTNEKAAPVHRHCVVSLCCSPGKAVAELTLVIKNKARPQTVLAEIPFPGCDCSAALRGSSFIRCRGASAK